MIFYKQDRFGGKDAPPKERGNCDKTCLASFLGISPGEIPDYQELPAGEWHDVRFDFLQKRGLAAFAVSFIAPLVPGYCLVIGKSPRGDWDHVVIGLVRRDNRVHVEYVHDPHPDQTFVDGVKYLEYILPMKETYP